MPLNYFIANDLLKVDLLIEQAKRQEVNAT
jgi:hypothetical protein